MKIAKAHLGVLNPQSYRYDSTDVELAAGKHGRYRTWVELRSRDRHLAGPNYEIRRYSSEIEPGCEDSRLLDWHEIWSGNLQVIGSRLVLTGFSRGTDGKVKDGQHPKGGDVYDYDGDEGDPFVGVEWVLTPGEAK